MNMKFFGFAVLLFSFSGIVDANLKYNPYTGKYENAAPNSQLKYNPYSGNFSYEKPKSQLKYNPYTGTYYYDK